MRIGSHKSKIQCQRHLLSSRPFTDGSSMCPSCVIVPGWNQETLLFRQGVVVWLSLIKTSSRMF